MNKFFTLYFSLAMSCYCCSESGFNANNNREGNPVPATTTDSGGDGETPDTEECVDGDRINLQYPPEIEDCVSQSKIYNFDTNTCVDTDAASFDCSFAALADTVAGIGVSNTSIISAKDDGALLISCAEKNDGKTIIAQWIYQGSYDECNYEDIEAIRITTACYKFYLEGEVPPTETPEQRSAAVQACLNE